MTAPVELVRELLYYRDMRMIDHRDWGLITAFLAGSSLALPILAPFALGSLVVLGIDKIRKARRRHAIAGIVLPAPIPAPGATTVYGIARKFRITAEGLRRLDDERASSVAGLERVLVDWDPAEVAEFARWLARFNTDIERLTGHPWPRPAGPRGPSASRSEGDGGS